MKYTFLILAAVTLGMAGCGSKETTYIGPDGTEVKGSADGKMVTVKTPEGNTTFGAVSVTEGDLGLPFYPGSTEKPDTSAKVDTPQGTTVSCTRTTKDEPKAVAEFYKGKFPSLQSSSMDTGDTKIAGVNGKLDDGSQVSMSATKKGSEDTDIAMIVVKKK